MASETKPAPKRKRNVPRNDIVEKRPLRIGEENLFKKYVTSGEFRRALCSGKYVYVDGLFVLRPLAIFLLENGV